MDVHDITDEASAVARILELCDPSAGDDAAVLAVPADGLCVSTDPTLLGVHAPRSTTPHELGRRAAGRALSDLAAMAALPRAMTCSVLVPAGEWSTAVDAVAGLVERGREQGCPLVGGDVCRTDGPLGLVVTVLGRRGTPRAGGFVARSGAQVGDALVVTGRLGAAARAFDEATRSLPEPPDRLWAGVALGRAATAMVDISDGIARDAANLARASNVAIDVWLDQLPLAEGVDARRAAGFGDDYELLATIPPAALDAAEAALRAADPELRLTQVGEVVDAGSVVRFLDAGREVEAPRGFVHT